MAILEGQRVFNYASTRRRSPGPRSATIRRMKWFTWFDSAQAQDFARELAAFMVAELAGKRDARDAKFSAKAEKTLAKAARRLQDFKARHPLNFYTRSKLANAFLWALKDAGLPPAYADELAEWLTLRL
jgi:hypothetical protein